jgi:hypothetical protein
MVLASIWVIYTVVETIHMLWMGRYIHRHATSTIHAGHEIAEVGKSLGHPWATNNVMAHSLRHQIYIEWFPHPLESYTHWLRTFICCGWADIYTAMPLPPYILALNLLISANPWVTDGLQITSWRIPWGTRPTWNGSHIHLKHIQGIWDHSYAVDGQIYTLPCYFHHTCWPWNSWSWQILGSQLGYK